MIEIRRSFPMLNNRRDDSAQAARARQSAIRTLERRRDRRLHFPVPLFAEYGWDILLVLFAEEPNRPAQKITLLAERVSAPITTAMRWLDYLEQRQLIGRNVSDVDRREVLISLTDAGRSSMLSYFGTHDSEPSMTMA